MLAQLCPNPLLGFVCGLMHNLLRELPAARAIYADPTSLSRETGLSFQLPAHAALKDGRSEDRARSPPSIWLSPKATCSNVAARDQVTPMAELSARWGIGFS